MKNFSQLQISFHVQSEKASCDFREINRTLKKPIKVSIFAHIYRLSNVKF